MSNAPECNLDFYSDTFIANPWPHYAEMRALGPVVWMTRLGNFAFTQFAEVRAGLRDTESFQSGEGTAGDDFGCAFQRGNTVASDGARHKALRSAIAPQLERKSLEAIRPVIDASAATLIAGLKTGGTFNSAVDLAQHLPLTIVRDQVGLPDYGKDNMLRWAGAAFNVQGIQNARGEAAVEQIKEMRAFVASDDISGSLKPGSWSGNMMEACKRGEIDPDHMPFLLRDLINPSLDTTISAIGQMVVELARNPDEWAALKADPSLAKQAAMEAVRLSTPIRSFSRRATRDVEMAGVVIPEGSRVMMLYASANRDERMFDDPDRFILNREARQHLGFGAGPHMCVGMHLALMELEAIATALADQVDRIEVGSPIPALNNTICAFADIPTVLH
jgi:cytochrome P450